MTESDVQLAAEGSGPHIRTLQHVKNIDGEDANVEQQVITLADEHGTFLHGLATDALQREILLELKAIHLGFTYLTGQNLDEDSI